MSDFLRCHELQHARPPCPSPTPGVHPNSCPSSWWCHPTISSSVVPFSSCPQSLPASESFPVSQLFAWGGQSIGVSAFISPSKEYPGLISFRSPKAASCLAWRLNKIVCSSTMFYRDSHFEISIYISYSLLVVVDKIKKNFLVALVKKNIVRPGILFYWNRMEQTVPLEPLILFMQFNIWNSQLAEIRNKFLWEDGKYETTNWSPFPRFLVMK